jgi:hypothetical protein
MAQTSFSAFQACQPEMFVHGWGMIQAELGKMVRFQKCFFVHTFIELKIPIELSVHVYKNRIICA